LKYCLLFHTLPLTLVSPSSIYLVHPRISNTRYTEFRLTDSFRGTNYAHKARDECVLHSLTPQPCPMRIEIKCRSALEDNVQQGLLRSQHSSSSHDPGQTLHIAYRRHGTRISSARCAPNYTINVNIHHSGAPNYDTLHQPHTTRG